MIIQFEILVDKLSLILRSEQADDNAGFRPFDLA
jgi:hypothetical protein